MYRHGRSVVFFDLDRSCPRLYPRVFVGLRSLTYVVYQSLNLRCSPVCISFRSLSHSPFPTSPVLHSFPLPVLHQFALPFVQESKGLSRSPFPTSSVLHRFPRSLSFISSQSVNSVCVCVYGGAVYVDLVTQLQYAAISEVISLLLPPTWVALLHARAAWVTIVPWPVI
jgi:hypothetical protein